MTKLFTQGNYWNERGVFRSNVGLSDRHYDRMISCSGKIEFDTEDDAHVSIREHGHMNRLSAYKCRHCQYWHVGHG